MKGDAATGENCRFHPVVCILQSSKSGSSLRGMGENVEMLDRPENGPPNLI